VTPINQGNRPGKTNRPRRHRRTLAKKFTPDTYRQAVRRAIQRAGVESWHPHQLRHSAAASIRAAFAGSSGVEAARVALGHQQLSMTDFYAGVDTELARQVALRIG
jgi:integrase